MRNTPLQTAIHAVLDSDMLTQFHLGVQFISSQNSGYTFTPLFVDGMSIAQMAHQQCFDDIRLKFKVSYKDYADLYDNMQNLYAVITITFVDKNGAKQFTTRPIIKTYRASLIDPKDIRKKITDAHLRTEFDTSTEVRLMDDVIYNIKSVGINTIYQSMGILDAMRHASYSFGMTGVTAEVPDNNHLYDQILVPPTRNFSDFYTWLQSRYGVYMTGITNYYTEGHLFIYGPFNTSPQTEKTLVVYQSEEGSLSGISHYSKLNGTSLEVVVSTVHNVTDHSAYGAENVGTSVSFLRSAESVDGVVQYDPVNGAKFNQDVALNISLARSNMIGEGMGKTIYAKATDNPFALASHLVEHQATMVEVEWAMAVPYQLRPGLAVTYYSDNQGTTLKRTGILDHLKTVMLRVSRGGSTTGGDIFTAATKLGLRLQPEGILTNNVSA